MVKTKYIAYSRKVGIQNKYSMSKFMEYLKNLVYHLSKICVASLYMYKSTLLILQNAGKYHRKYQTDDEKLGFVEGTFMVSIVKGSMCYCWCKRLEPFII